MKQFISAIFTVGMFLTPHFSAIADDSKYRVVEFNRPQTNEQLLSRSAHYRALKMRGNEAMQVGNYDRAIALYDQAINLDRDKPSAWKRRGDALVKKGDYQAAIEAYNEAMNFTTQNKSQLQQTIEATREKLVQDISS